VPKLRTTALAWRNVEGQVIALDLDASMYLSVNEVGSLVWGLLAEGADVDLLRAAVLDAFDVTPDQAEQDIRAFLGELERRGLTTE
jgi:hypothetical protein